MKIIAPKQLMENQAPVMRNGGVFSRASLDLQFARTRTLDSRITFTRSSSGTYVDAAGIIRTAGNNVARFDHDPVTGESLGLLMERSGTNLMPYSVATTSNWSPTGGTTTNLSLNALGVFPGVRVASGGYVYNGLNTNNITGLTNGTTYTATFWFRAGDTNSSDKVRFLFRNDTDVAPSDIVKNSSTTAFDSVSSYTATDSGVGTATSNLTVLSAETLADGLTYKLVASFVCEGSSTDAYKFGIHSNSSTTGETVIALGMQLEEGSFATSYIATSGSSASRSADVASITGTNFSSWYNQTEGTVFSDFIVNGDKGSNQFIYCFAGGTDIDEEIFVLKNAGSGSNTDDSKHSVRVNSANEAVFNNDNQSNFNSQIKSAFGISATSTNRAVNGSLGTVDTSTTMPTVDNLRVGRRANGTAIGNFSMARFTYWPTRLSDNTLQQITS